MNSIQDMKRMLALMESDDSNAPIDNAPATDIADQIVAALESHIRRAVAIVEDEFETSPPSDDDEADDVYGSATDTLHSNGIDLTSEVIGLVLELKYGVSYYE